MPRPEEPQQQDSNPRAVLELEPEPEPEPEPDCSAVLSSMPSEEELSKTVRRRMGTRSESDAALEPETQPQSTRQVADSTAPGKPPRALELASAPSSQLVRGGGRAAVGVKERNQQLRERRQRFHPWSDSSAATTDDDNDRCSRPLLQFVFTRSSSSSDEEDSEQNVDDENPPPGEWRQSPYENGFRSPSPRALAANATSTGPTSPTTSVPDPLGENDDDTHWSRRQILQRSRSPSSGSRSRSHSPRRVRASLDARARSRRADVLAQIRGLYSIHTPEKTSEQVDEIILRWDGREEALLKRVSARYESLVVT